MVKSTNPLSGKGSSSPKVTRDAFIFLTPKSKEQKEDFAQCGPCRMFVPEKYLDGMIGGRCIAHGSTIPVDEDDSCGIFTSWPTPDGSPVELVVKEHAEELIKGIPGAITPKESGLVDRLVQCHRCRFADKGAKVCGLFVKLNSKLPEIFDLDEKITPNSCCNAQEPK